MGLARKFSKMFRAVGGTPAELKAIAGDEGLARQILGVVRGFNEIKPIEHIIHRNTVPLEPEGWEVRKHKKGGVVKIERRGDDLYLGEKKVELYLSRCQCDGEVIKGGKLQEEVSRKGALNACVLDYLLAHPELIPDSWKVNKDGKNISIFFWGTTYFEKNGVPCVRFLHWNGSRWRWSYNPISFGWCSQYPAAVSGK